jgi:hypothetical protein
MIKRFDLFAFSLLISSAVVLACLAVDPKGFILREWQTLIASFVALGAATLAYHAAMAKVDYDRAKERRDTERKQLGLYLRVRHAAEKLRDEAHNVVILLGFNTRFLSRRTISPPQIQMTEREEFDEAWKNLELLPAVTSFDLDTIRSELPRALKRLKSIPDSDVIEIPTIGVSSTDPLGAYLKIAERIEKAAARIIATLDAQIVSFKLD